MLKVAKVEPEARFVDSFVSFTFGGGRSPLWRRLREKCLFSVSFLGSRKSFSRRESAIKKIKGLWHSDLFSSRPLSMTIYLLNLELFRPGEVRDTTIALSSICRAPRPKRFGLADTEGEARIVVFGELGAGELQGELESGQSNNFCEIETTV